MVPSFLVKNHFARRHLADIMVDAIIYTIGDGSMYFGQKPICQQTFGPHIGKLNTPHTCCDGAKSSGQKTFGHPTFG
jgi:hypothetical protein